MLKRCATLAILSVGLPAAAQTYDLKGYAVGQPLTECPAETIERAVKGSSLYCSLGPTTLANSPVTSVVLHGFGGKLISFMFSLENRGRSANSSVRDALIEKFGRPHEEKIHVNEATWSRGAERMHFDGWRGRVFVVDSSEFRRSQQQESQVNKKDL